MKRRVTILVDDDIDSMVRSVQAKAITEHSKSISYSFVLSIIVKEGLKRKDAVEKIIERIKGNA